MSIAHSRAAVRVAPSGLLRLAARQLATLGLACIALWLLWDRLPPLDLGEIHRAVGSVRSGQWMLALAGVAVSFWALGRYDVLMHGLLGTGCQTRRAHATGAMAIAVGQFTGAGLLTGALVRWRMLPDLNLGQAVKLTIAVSVSFLFGAATVASAALLISGAQAHLRGPAVAMLCLCLAAFVLTLVQPRALPRLPTARALGLVVGLVAVDLAGASLALHALLPAGLDLPWSVLFAPFVLATVAGLACGTPGGLGPLDLALIALLPAIPAEPLLATISAYRLVYFLLPAALATAALLFGPFRTAGPTQALELAAQPGLPQALEADAWRAPEAEVGLLRQRQHTALTHRGQLCGPAALAGQSLVLVGDPVGPARTDPALAQDLTQLARSRQCAPLVYKCRARTAARLRAAGWRPLRIAVEAAIDPSAFDLDQPCRRQLRRLLRKAARSGVQAHAAGSHLPLDEMSAISCRWSAAHGGERGFSMGRFCPAYVRAQRVVLAFADDRLVAFATFHEARHHWALDLVRYVPGAPAGTMHALVVAAIDAARAEAVPTVSLAAVPVAGGGPDNPGDRLWHRMIARRAGDGLTRFKQSFAPDWQPLYACAPSARALAVGLWDVAREVHRPRPLARRAQHEHPST